MEQENQELKRSIQTGGGAYFEKSTISNEGGVNVYGENSGPITYQDFSHATFVNNSPKAPQLQPDNYFCNSRPKFFQERPGEFQELERILFEAPLRPVRLGLVGIGGCGKSTLALELAYRYTAEFPAGVFWLTTIGVTLLEWQHSLAELALNTGYLPPDDNSFDQDREFKRSRYLSQYLGSHPDSLLILDNLDDIGQLESILPKLSGGEWQGTVIFTTRRQSSPPPGITLYHLPALSFESSWRILFGNFQPALTALMEAGSQDQQTASVKELCKLAGYLPLALVLLRDLLQRYQPSQLAERLNRPDRLKVLDKGKTDHPPLLATFALSWEQVDTPDAQRLFKLAACFAEAVSIPLWLLGLPAGLGENFEILDPLEEARTQLQDLSLLEDLGEGQVRLHPLLREFGLQLINDEGNQGIAVLQQAAQTIGKTFENPTDLQNRAHKQGFQSCLKQIRLAIGFVERLDFPDVVQKMGKLERWLDQESYLLAEGKLWPGLPGFFYQQIYNHIVEEGEAVTPPNLNTPWLRKLAPVGKENNSLLRILTGHTAGLSCVAFSPDNKYILTGSLDQTARLWEGSSAQLLTILEGHTDEVWCVAFSPDSKYCLTGGKDKTIRLWEIDSGELLAVLEGHTGVIWNVVFSPDGKSIYTSSADFTIRIWDFPQGTLLNTYKLSDSVRTIALSPDDHYLLVGSFAWSALLIDTSSWTILYKLDLHRSTITSAAFSPDNRFVVTGSWDNTARIWEVPNGQPLQVLEGHKNWVNAVSFSMDGKLILTGSKDQTLRLWEASSAHLVGVLEGHTEEVTGIAFSGDSRFIVSSSEDKTARIWDATKPFLPPLSQSHTAEISCLAISSDSRFLLSGSEDKTVKLWEIANNEVRLSLESGMAIVESVAFSPDGSVMAASNSYTTTVWETASGRQLYQIFVQASLMTCLVFSPDGRYLLTGALDKTARLWEATTGNPVRSFLGHNNGIWDVAFSPDGQYILTGAYDHTARLNNINSGQTEIIFQGHSDGVTKVTFSPDGSKVLTASKDKTAKLWETNTGKLLVSFEGHSEEVTSVAFSPDGKLVLTSDSSGMVCFWVPSTQQTTSEETAKGSLLMIYQAGSEVKVVQWQGSNQIYLADNGGTRFRPFLHNLQTENFPSNQY